MGNKKSKAKEPLIEVTEDCCPKSSHHHQATNFDDLPMFRQRVDADWSSNPLLNPSLNDARSQNRGDNSDQKVQEVSRFLGISSNH
jgi:hypothetical protein